MQYYRLSEGLNKYKLVPSTEDLYSHIKNNQKDYYRSLFLYNDEQYKHWKITGSVAGIKDVVCKSLLWDFDSADNIKLAKDDATTLVGRLVKLGVPSENIQVTFSGNKGICVEIETNKEYKQDEFKNITFALAEDLSTFDRVVNDAQRIIRITGTKHPKSGLFKIPLSINQLAELPVETIKALATNDEVDADVVEGWKPITLPFGVEKLKVATTKEEKKSTSEIYDLDITLKPKWMSEVRFALQEGYFPSGEGKRNHAFLILASTYRKQGFNKELTYRLLKGVAEVQARRTETDRYPDVELWKNIVEVVYSPHWKGGIYKDNEDPFLIETAKALGIKVKADEPTPLVPISNVTDVFKRFAVDIDKNTVKLGIPIIDSEIRVTTSMLVGLLSPPGGGKTSVSLGILNELSRSNQKAIFFSLDMGAPLVYQRLLQKHTGVGGKKLFEMYKSGDKRVKEFEAIVDKEYKNVSFCFRSGVNTEDIRNFIMEHEQQHGERAKLIVIDYLECLSGPYSDSNANTAMIAQQLKDIANDFQITVLLLLQPQKHAGDPSAELLSYRAIKGASAIEQACSVIFTLWRPGFNPAKPEEDRYATVAVVKNRMGSLGKFDFNWNGLTGQLSELDQNDAVELEEIIKRRAAERALKNEGL